MSTLADELLQDFEDTDSGEEDVQQHDFLRSSESGSRPILNGHDRRQRNYTDHDGGMELDGDEEEGDADEDMMDAVSVREDTNKLEAGDNEEDAKAKVENMQLGGVDDVRSVARLMKTLAPVLEVSDFPSPLGKVGVYIDALRELALTRCSPSYRK